MILLVGDHLRMLVECLNKDLRVDVFSYSYDLQHSKLAIIHRSISWGRHLAYVAALPKPYIDVKLGNERLASLNGPSSLWR